MSVEGAGFGVDGMNLPFTLAPGEKVLFQVRFSPQVAGHVDGTVAFTSSASTSELYLLNVHGTGVLGNVLNSYPLSLSFGKVSVGATSLRSEVLTNSGSSNINISQMNVTGSGFNVSGVFVPLTLTAGQKLSFNVGFTPQLAGITSGLLSIVSDAASPALTVPLSGTGVAVDSAREQITATMSNPGRSTFT
jgi:Abnormal spindle-like microcephaly-assoc'd, ASPM-SPD-2-Hydin